jgi:hypothetical protein
LFTNKIIDNLQTYHRKKKKKTNVPLKKYILKIRQSFWKRIDGGHAVGRSADDASHLYAQNVLFNFFYSKRGKIQTQVVDGRRVITTRQRQQQIKICFALHSPPESF